MDNTKSDYGYLFPIVGSFLGAIIGAIYVGYYLGEVRGVSIPINHRDWGHNDMLPIGLVLYERGFLSGLVVGTLCGFLLWVWWWARNRKREPREP